MMIFLHVNDIFEQLMSLYARSLYDSLSTVKEPNSRLELQVKQTKEETFSCQTKNGKESLNQFDISNTKSNGKSNEHRTIVEIGKEVDIKIYRV